MGYEHREDALGGGEAGKGKHKHTHTGWIESRAMIGSNLDTCRRCPPPQIKLMGYEHREDALGGRVAGKGKHTHKHTHTHTVSAVIHRVDGATGKDRTQY